MADLDLSQIAQMAEKLKSDPELIKMASGLFSAMPPPGGEEKKDGQPSVSSKLPEVPMLPGQDERSRALLCALKPYMSGKRAEMIDYILGLERMGNMLNLLGQKGGEGNV